MNHVDDLRLLFLVGSGFFYWLIVVHFTLEVAEVLNIFLLLVRLLNFHCENHVGTVAFLKSALHLLDKIDLLPLHLSDLVVEYDGLPLIVLHVILNVLLASDPVLIKEQLLPLDPFLVELELTLFFTHLVRQLFKHLDLLASLIVHDLRLL